MIICLQQCCKANLLLTMKANPVAGKFTWSMNENLVVGNNSLANCCSYDHDTMARNHNLLIVLFLLSIWTIVVNSDHEDIGRCNPHIHSMDFIFCDWLSQNHRGRSWYTKCAACFSQSLFLHSSSNSEARFCRNSTKETAEC